MPLTKRRKSRKKTRRKKRRKKRRKTRIKRRKKRTNKKARKHRKGRASTKKLNINHKKIVGKNSSQNNVPVSYTHLTLPTNREV